MLYLRVNLTYFFNFVNRMREIAFIKQNKSKWLDFEKQLNNKADRNSDELANSYIQLLNDLAFSQTYYPKSKTTVYLNYLVSQIYINIAVHLKKAD